jgi:beta-lactamase class A
MRNCFTFCLLTLTLSAGDLETVLQQRIAKGPGKVFLAAKNLKSGATVQIQGNDKVRTASTIKLPVLVEIYAQAAAGKLKLTETLPMREADIVSGSGVLRELGPGVELPLLGVANLMIVVSDNTATNMLIERLGADAVNARMDSLGLPATRLMRKIRGDGTQLKAAQGWSKAGLLEENKKYGIGSSTSLEMVRLLELLETNKLPGSKEIVATLKRQQYNDGIGRKLPSTLAVANKTGALDHLRSDVAIVYGKSGPIAIAITVEDIPAIDYGEDNPGLHLIADLAKLIVDHLDK